MKTGTNLIGMLLRPLLNERGNVGDEEITPEEQAILDGDTPGEDPPADPPEDPPADPPADPPGGTGDENMVPQSRFDEVFSKGKAAEEKLDLFKTDTDAYYEKYPDEKPDEPTPPVSDLGGLVVQGGEHDGKTLRDIHAVDPFEATRLLNEYQQDKRDTEAESQATAERIATETQAEEQEFLTAREMELFKTTDGLTEDQVSKAQGVYDATVQWAIDNGKSTYSMEDAYVIMNQSGNLSKARGEGATGIVEAMRNGSVQTVSVGGGGGEETGFDAFLAMTADQLADQLDKMDEPASMEFLSKAPQELRNKFPSVPWG